MSSFFDKIIDFFDWFISTVESLLKFVWNIIDGTLQLLELLPGAVSTLSDSLTWLPSILVGFAATTITVSVIFIIIGREHGGKG